MQIVFVRHGTTAWNKEKRWQGSSDVPLSDLGRAQARVTARYLLEHFEVPEAIYTSDLSWAFETSEFIAGEFDGKEVNLYLHSDHRTCARWRWMLSSKSLQPVPPSPARMVDIEQLSRLKL